MAYKLKIGPSQSLKLKGNAGFALPLLGGDGIATSKSGGIWTVDLDYSEVQTGSTVNDATAYVLTWDSASGLFTRLNITDLKVEFQGTFDGYYQPLDATLTALAALDSTAGVLAQTGADTFARRTLTGTANEITVADGDGVSGNPTVSLPAALTFTGKTVTGGTYAGAVSFNKVAVTAPATAATLTIADGKTLTASDDATVSGTNTGDQTITLTGDVTGSGTGSFAATIGAGKVTSAMLNADVFSTAHSWSGVQTFTNPVVGTQTAGDNSTKAASTAFVQAAVTGATAGVSSLNGQTGALALMVQPQGRLTLTSGTAVMATSTVGQTTVYYTPYCGNQCPIYDGTNFIPTTFTELSQATTDTTKSPAAVANNSNYDIFVWNDSGTIRATRGPAWTSSTARGTGAGTTELDFTTAFPTNKNAITNGPAANRGTYVGTIRSNGTATIDWQFGGLASGGTAGIFGVWNAYNRVTVATQVMDNTNSWTYAVNATWRAANAKTTMRVSAVRGLDIEGIEATYYAIARTSAGGTGVAGVGLNSTTAYSGTTGGTINTTDFLAMPARYSGLMGLGYVYVSAIEYNDTTNTTTWRGLITGLPMQSGLHAVLRQ